MAKYLKDLTPAPVEKTAAGKTATVFDNQVKVDKLAARTAVREAKKAGENPFKAAVTATKPVSGMALREAKMAMGNPVNELEKADRLAAQMAARNNTGAGKIGQRLANVVAAAAKDTAGSMVELGAQGLPTYGDAIGTQMGGGAIGAALKEAKRQGITMAEAEAEVRKQRQAQQLESQRKAFEVADKLKRESQEQVAQAKEGLGRLGQFGVDLGFTGVQMAGDMALSALVPGSGLAAMGARSFGSGAGDARREGKDAHAQLLTGAKSAAIEVLTEKMFDGLGVLGKAYGSGALDDAADRLIKSVTRSEAGRKALRTLAGAAEEGLEEVASDLLNPVADKLLGLSSRDASWLEGVTAKQVVYDALLGSAMGLLGGAGEAAIGAAAGRTAENPFVRAAEKRERAAQRSTEGGTAQGNPFLSAERQRQLDQARDIAKRFGAALEISPLANAEGRYANGVITIDPETENPVRSVLVHELTHHMENGGLYEQFAQKVMGHIGGQRGVNVEGMLAGIKADYAAIGQNLTDEGARRELVAKYAQEHLFTDEATVKRLLAEDRNLFQRIYDWIRDGVTRLMGSPEQRFLIEAQNLYEKALREAGQTVQANPFLQRRDAQYEINPFHRDNIRSWAEDGMPAGEYFVLGSTGSVLQGLGAVENDIYMSSDKIKEILKDHPEMTVKEIQQIPNALEDPIMVLKSRNYDGRPNNTRIVVMGDIVAQDGRPVAVILDLRPFENRVVINDMQRVTSAYTKDKDPVKFFEKSYVMYADKKRAAKLLRTAGFRMPVELQQSGSMGSISYFRQDVNLQGNPFYSVFEKKSAGRGFDELARETASAEDAYMDALAQDENAQGQQRYTVGDAVRDFRARLLTQQEAPVEVEREAPPSAEDMADLVDLFADVANPIGTREDRIRDTENMVTNHTVVQKASAKQRAESAWSYFVRKMVDAGHSVTKVGQAVNDPYLYAMYNQARASASAGTNMINGEQTDVLGRNVGRSLNDIFDLIRAIGEDYYQAFQLYLFDLHNIDRMSLSQNKEELVIEAQKALAAFDEDYPDIRTTTEAQLMRLAESTDEQVAELARERIRLIRELNKVDAIRDKPVFGYEVTAEDSRERARRALKQHPEFVVYQQQVRKYIDNLMQYRVDSGLMSAEDAVFLKRFYPNYVPTMRVGSKSTGAGRNLNTVRVGKTVGRAVGGNENLVALHEALGRQTMKVVREGSKNRFAAQMLTDYLNHGDSANVNRYIQDATEYESDFSLDSIDNTDEEPLKKDKTVTAYLDGKMWEMTVDDSLFEAMKALSPDAQEANGLKKAIRSANNLFKGLVTGYNPFFLVRNTVRDLQTAGLYTRDSVAFAKNYPSAIREIAQEGEYWRLYKAMGGVYSSVFDYATGTTKEPTTKAGQFVARVEALNMATEQAPRLAEFMSVIKKAEATGEVTQKALADALYAAADVTVNFGRSGTLGKWLNANFVPFLNPGIQGFDKMVRRVTETRGAKEWAKLAVRATLLGIAPSLLNRLLYHDDDEWEQLRDSDKDTNYMFKLGNGIWLKIPKGRELSVLGITASRITDLAQGGKVDWRGYISTVGNQVAPANPLKSNIASAIGDSGLLDASNPGRTWYGGNIESQRLQSYAPGQRYDSSTDVISKAVGGALNVSPAKLNYILDQYSGVVGDIVLPLLTPQAERDPFSKAFTVDVKTNNRVGNDFYAERDELTYAKNGGDQAAAVVSRFWARQASSCSEIWKEIREVETSKLSDKEKRRQTRELKEAVTTIQRNALEVEETYRKAAERYVAAGLDTDEAYREANRECFGAEYALEAYNKDVYARAQNAYENGVGYDAFYDYYFATKGMKATEDESVIQQKMNYLRKSRLSLKVQSEIYYSDIASDSVLVKQAELESQAGITSEEYFLYKVDSCGKTLKADILAAIDRQELANSQKDALYISEDYKSSKISDSPWRGGNGADEAGKEREPKNPFKSTVERREQMRSYSDSAYGANSDTTKSVNPFLAVIKRQQQGSGGTLPAGVSSGGGNPFLRAAAPSGGNPFLRAAAVSGGNPFLRRP